MKKLCILLFLILLCTGAYARTNVMVMNSATGAPPGVASYVLFWCGWEGTWSSPTYTMGANDHSEGDTTGTAASSCIVNTDDPAVGSKYLDAPSALDYMEFTPASNNIWATDQGNVAFWFKADTWTAGTDFFKAQDAGGTNYMRVIQRVSEELRVIINATGSDVTWTSTDFNYDTSGDPYVFIEIVWNATADTVYVYVDNVSLTISEGNSQAFDAFASGDITLIHFGGPGSSGSDFHQDNHMIFDDSSQRAYSVRNNAAPPS